jgi:hypothetical protein
MNMAGIVLAPRPRATTAMLTKLDYDFAKIVWVPRPCEESNIADRAITPMRSTESEFLGI